MNIVKYELEITDIYGNTEFDTAITLTEEVIENEDEIQYNVSYAPFAKPTMITVEINQNSDKIEE
mgnify:CR=1 FL=1